MYMRVYRDVDTHTYRWEGKATKWSVLFAVDERNRNRRGRYVPWVPKGLRVMLPLRLSLSHHWNVMHRRGWWKTECRGKRSETGRAQFSRQRFNRKPVQRKPTIHRLALPSAETVKWPSLNIRRRPGQRRRVMKYLPTRRRGRLVYENVIRNTRWRTGNAIFHSQKSSRQGRNRNSWFS